MQPVKVSEWIDIQAPREEVFALVTHIKRRMQLSPLWGIAQFTEPCGDYPAVGSSYMVSLVAAGQSAGSAEEDEEEGVEAASQAQVEYETVITAYEPPAHFAYCLDVDMQTSVDWTINRTPRGCRLTYTETFQPTAENDEAFNQTVRKTIQDWLRNIQRYAELRQTHLKRMFRWLLDHIYLNQRPDQRRTIVLVVFMHITGAIAFAMAALAMGIASLFL